MVDIAEVPIKQEPLKKNNDILNRYHCNSLFELLSPQLGW